MPLAREQRKLAAIVAADVVGYSRLMGRDESGTLARLRRTRSERLDPVLKKYGGRLVKLTGDGALVEFGSAVDALSAAIEFQQVMTEANGDQSADTALVFRMGLHLGDLIVEGDDLYGDGVNVAARLEGEAPAGGVLISRNVRDAVAGRVKATFEDLGSLSLKNIERPIRAFRVHWEALDWRRHASSEEAVAHATAAQVLPPLPDKPSIAVLPFQNMSGDPEQEYFADGMVEEITTALSRFKSLFVIARNSSFAYKGRSPDIRQVGRGLGVRYVLEGSVRKAATKVRITGQLVESETGAHLWADRFDGSLEDVFELQDQVTMSVVGAIAPKLDQAEIQRAKRKPVDSLDAYDIYLRGSAYSHVLAKAEQKEALKLFRRAIELDANFAIAYAAAAYCHSVFKGIGLTLSANEVVQTCHLARRAVELDKDDAVVLATAAWPLAQVGLDLDFGTHLADRALALNANLAMAWGASGWMNMWAGKPDVGIDRFGRAMRLSPLDLSLSMTRVGNAHAHFMSGRYDEALSLANDILHERQSTSAYRIAAASAAMAGHVDEAKKLGEQFLRLDPGRRVSNLEHALGPYRSRDLDRYREGLRLAGLPE